MDLTLIRQDIDKIDAELIALLEKRMTLVNQVTAYKKATGKAVLDASREQMVLENVARQVSNKDFKETIVATFSDLMKHSRAYQSSQLGVKEC